MRKNPINARISAIAQAAGISCVRTYTHLQKTGKRKVKFYAYDAAPAQLTAFTVALRRYFPGAVVSYTQTRRTDSIVVHYQEKDYV